MIFDAEEKKKIYEFIKKKIEPLTSAEPSVVADYIISLLLDDKSIEHLEKTCFSHLQTFLEEKTGPFVGDLFSYIKSVRNNSNGNAVNRREAPNGRQENDNPPSRKRNYRDDYDEQRSYLENKHRKHENSNGGPPRSYRDERRNSNHDVRKQSVFTKSTSVTVRNIPPEFCTADKVYNFFKKFGFPVKVIVSRLDRTAVVEFNTENDAEKAYQYPEAFFNNRFVRIFYHRPNDIPTERAESDLDIYQPKIDMTAEDRAKKLDEAEKLKLEIQEKKAALLHKQDEERKALIAKLDKMNPEDRQKILDSLNNVTNTIATANSNEEFIAKTLEISKARENKELEMKLQSLKDEVASYGGTVLPGRGRGRPYMPRGGRGGIVKSKRLDLRPKTLEVSGFPSTFKPFLQAHFSKFGVLENLSFNDSTKAAVIKYESRFAAEQAIEKGSQPEGESFSMNLQWQPTEKSSNNSHSMRRNNEANGSAEEDEYREQDDQDRSWKR